MVRENQKGDAELQPALKCCTHVGRIKLGTREKITIAFLKPKCGVITLHQTLGLRRINGNDKLMGFSKES